MAILAQHWLNVDANVGIQPEYSVVEHWLGCHLIREATTWQVELLSQHICIINMYFYCNTFTSRSFSSNLTYCISWIELEIRRWIIKEFPQWSQKALFECKLSTVVAHSSNTLNPFFSVSHSITAFEMVKLTKHYIIIFSNWNEHILRVLIQFLKWVTKLSIFHVFPHYCSKIVGMTKVM